MNRPFTLRGWLLLITLLAHTSHCLAQANGTLIVRNRQGESDEFARPLEYAALESFPAVLKVQLVSGSFQTVFRSLVAEDVQYPKLSDTLADASALERLKKADAHLLTVMKQYPRCGEVLRPVEAATRSAVEKLEAGQVLLRGKWISKDEFALLSRADNPNKLSVFSVGGKTYVDVQLVGLSGEKITISHAQGTSAIKLGDLTTKQAEKLASTSRTVILTTSGLAKPSSPVAEALHTPSPVPGDVTQSPVKWHFQAGGPILAQSLCGGDGILLLQYGSSDTVKLKAEYLLSALDLQTGREVWRATTGLGSSLQAKGEKVYIEKTTDDVGKGTLDHAVVALNVRNGRELWRFQTGGEITNCPVTLGFGGIVYVGSTIFGQEMSAFHALDCQTGRKLWGVTCKGQGGFTACTPDNAGRVYIKMMDVPTIASVNGKGTIDWELKDPDGRMPLGYAPMLQDDRNIYYGVGALGSIAAVLAVGKTSGALAWTMECGGWQPPHLSMDPNGGLYVVTEPDIRNLPGRPDRLIALNRFTGAELWSISLPTPGRTLTMGASGVMYLSTGNQIVAIATQSGKVLWRLDARQQFSAAVFKDGRLCVGNEDGFVYELDAGTGMIRGRFDTQGPVRGSGLMIEENGLTIVSNVKGDVYALRMGR